MAVIPINLARVSQNLRAFNLLQTVHRNTTALFNVQNQLATGLRVLKPSDDPIAAARINTADRRLDLIEQIERNLLHANRALAEEDAAVQDALELLRQAQTTTSEAIDDTTAPDQRSALAGARCAGMFLSCARWAPNACGCRYCRISPLSVLKTRSSPLSG